ncbi:FAD-dependent oxidoreductase [Gemmiger formicilis]|uniref:FAD-dependent oxidoreductase n=1 Tax=Gemmiger formicilis TaxID=745368 RepID=UPI001956A5D4|nr:FAD-dependent oxidoreductase [Gemmiger formicilis]MBM6914154.1 FAD-dependent oxidoreductase [Gemmiger formicilis]
MKKNSILACVLAGALLLSGCSNTAASGSAGKYTAGTYEATAQGYGGSVTVTMTVDADSITDVKAVGENETEGVGSKAIEQLPGAILEAQSCEVDGIAGATFSSDAVLAAAKNCLAQASGTQAEPASVKMAPGTYTGQGTGFRVSEPITVNVTVSENEILDIQVDQVNTSEKPSILQSVVDLMLPRILENQSVAVDAITGATASSNGVKQAITDALTQALEAGGSDASAISAFQTAPAKSTETITLDTDVLVVGMGGSGVAAALSAAENGASVLAIDKAGKYGGTSELTSGPMAINVPSQVEAEIADWPNPVTGETETKPAGADLIDAEALYEDWLAYTTIDGVQTAKPEMIRIMIDESGYTDDWLTQYGFSFDPAIGFAGNSWAAFTPHTGAKALTESFFDSVIGHFEEMGGSYMLETEAYDLIYDEATNQVTGVLARSTADGTEYVINAKAVVLATGGYAGSAEMEETYLSNEYYPLKGAWKQFGMQQNDGKMIQAAIDDGAGTYNISVPPMVHVGGVDGFLSGYEAVPIEGQISSSTGRPAVWSVADIPLNMAISSNTLAVGADGKRFTSETALSMFNPWISGPHFYSIWGNEQIQDLIANGFDEVPYGPSTNYLGYGSSIPAGVPLPETEEILQAAIDAGYVYKADTIAELAEKMGFDPEVLEATVEEYNSYCATGVDEAFGKDAQYLAAVEGGPYYGIVGSSYCYSTCGGLDINTDFQVLLADGETPMGGLYAVGTDSMGVLFSEAKAYVTYGGAAQGWAYTSGRLAGQVVAEAVKE